MLKRKNLPYILVPTLGAKLCLNSCAKTNYDFCPIYPQAGPEVAKELEKNSFEQYPNFWEWLARLDKLRQELELCK